MDSDAFGGGLSTFRAKVLVERHIYLPGLSRGGGGNSLTPKVLAVLTPWHHGTPVPTLNAPRDLFQSLSSLRGFSGIEGIRLELHASIAWISIAWTSVAMATLSRSEFRNCFVNELDSLHLVIPL